MEPRRRVRTTRDPDEEAAERVDSDFDGLSDRAEALWRTNPYDQDSDDDGLFDGTEVEQKLYLEPGEELERDLFVVIATEKTDPRDPDTDDDGLTDYEELRTTFTDPKKLDSDGDGVGDAAEWDRGTNPRNPDTDFDGLTDGVEASFGSDPHRVDTDGDGLGDSEEYQFRTNPNRADTDDDGLSDYDEVRIHHTLPTERDSDGDGWTDYQEVVGLQPEELMDPPGRLPGVTRDDALARPSAVAGDPQLPDALDEPAEAAPMLDDGADLGVEAFDDQIDVVEFGEV